jgi:heat shock protein HtpX
LIGLGECMSWNIVRGLLALSLIVGFYVLAIGLAVVLFALPIAEIVYASRIHFQLLIICWGAGGSLVWALYPTKPVFTPPGPRLFAKDHPKLFSVLQSIATSTKQPLPSEVYLASDVNAWVLQRGGFLGIGAHRALGLGLPLIQQLNTDQLKAVIAHEFGHFAKGDTALGAWLYQTRTAIVKGAEGIDERRVILRWLFRNYATLFFKATHSISRQQEFIADRVAATVTSPATMQQALRAVEQTGVAFQSYFYNEVMPLLAAGFQPPILQGFNLFLAAPDVKNHLEQHLSQSLEAQQMQPFDTHPPMRERINALAKLPSITAQNTKPEPAIDLLNNLTVLEQELNQHFQFTGDYGVRKAITWENIGVAYQEIWRKHVELNKLSLTGVNFQSLSDLEAYKRLSRRLTFGKPYLSHLSEEQAMPHVRSIVGAALMLALQARGYTIDVPVAQHVLAIKNDKTVKPIELLEKVFQAQIPAQEWQAFCFETGIASINLDHPEQVQYES